MKLIEKQWHGFKAACISKDAPEIQLKEMKMAFYAGSTALLRIESKFESDEEALAKLKQIESELLNFPKENLEESLFNGMS